MQRLSYRFNEEYVFFSLINLAPEYNESKHLFTKYPQKHKHYTHQLRELALDIQHEHNLI